MIDRRVRRLLQNKRLNERDDWHIQSNHNIPSSTTRAKVQTRRNVAWHGRKYNISTRKLRVHGSGHSEPPRTDRFVSSSVGSLAFVPGKDGWLLLMIFSLTKNIIHRTQISESAERMRRWIERPHRRENLDQSKSRNSFLLWKLQLQEYLALHYVLARYHQQSKLYVHETTSLF